MMNFLAKNASIANYLIAQFDKVTLDIFRLLKFIKNLLFYILCFNILLIPCPLKKKNQWKKQVYILNLFYMIPFVGRLFKQWKFT